MSTGLKFPFTFTGQGMVAVSEHKENVKESIRIILLTEPGERITRPQFGTGLHQFLFEVMDSRLEEMISREVIHSLTRWEERITDISVQAGFDQMEEGILRIEVSYRLVDSMDMDEVTVRLER